MTHKDSDVKQSKKERDKKKKTKLFRMQKQMGLIFQSMVKNSCRVNQTLQVKICIHEDISSKKQPNFVSNRVNNSNETNLHLKQVNKITRGAKDQVSSQTLSNQVKANKIQSRAVLTFISKIQFITHKCAHKVKSMSEKCLNFGSGLWTMVALVLLLITWAGASEFPERECCDPVYPPNTATTAAAPVTPPISKVPGE